MVNKKTPKVSVIIPTYNRANLISKSIESVLNQTYTDFELIVIDDGSTDNTWDVVKSFDDERVKYVRHEKNKGLAASRNTGIKHSNGVFISFQDDDDKWLPEKLEKEIKLLKSSEQNVGIVYSGLCRIDGDKKTYWPESRHIKKEGNLTNELIASNFVHSLVSIRKSCFEKVGLYDENLRAAEDWDLNLRLSKYYEFKFINEALIVSDRRDDCLSRNLLLMLDCTEKIFEKHSDIFTKQKKSVAEIYGYLASQLCLEGHLIEGRKCFSKAIKKNPRDIRFYSGYFASFLGLAGYKKILEFFQRSYN